MTSSRSLRLATAAAALGLAAAAIASGAACAGAAQAGAPCTTGELTGRFAAVPGSAGAGNIVYALQVRNRSTHVCSVSGLPRLQLLGARGKALPTAASPAFRGAGAAIIIYLSPGASAWASARFSPDVPGPSEQTIGPCEPAAAKLRVGVGPGNAVLVVPIVPATPVCSRGRMSVSLLSKVRPTA